MQSIDWGPILSTFDPYYQDNFFRIPEEERNEILEWVSNQLQNGRFERVEGRMAVYERVIAQLDAVKDRTKAEFLNGELYPPEAGYVDWIKVPEYIQISTLMRHFEALLSILRVAVVAYTITGDAHYGLRVREPYTGNLTSAKLKYLAALKRLAGATLDGVNPIYMGWNTQRSHLRRAVNELVQKLGLKRRSLTELAGRIAEEAGITELTTSPVENVRQALFYRDTNRSIICPIDTGEKFVDNVAGLFVAIKRLDMLNEEWDTSTSSDRDVGGE